MRILAFASENWLQMYIGEYQPKKGWIQSTHSFTPPQPGDPVTIFGTKGRLGEVEIIDKRRSDPGRVPVEWYARVNRGSTMEQPFALAMIGSWPDSGVESTELALDDPDALQIATTYLRSRGLHVEKPLLTQAYQVDLRGDGQKEIALCAHSDMDELEDDKEASVYAVALLHTGLPAEGKTIALAAQTSHKPANRSLAEHEHFYGEREFYRLIAFHDIKGNGRKEIVLYRAKEDASQIEVFTFNGRRTRKVLSAYKANYN